MKTIEKKLLAFLLCCAWTTSGYAQTYPQGYFRSPLENTLTLAGNFGECRPNHFHTGLDFKTDGKENQKVLAVAEGCVSRVSISHSGYGNALYVTHPNGYTSVYGHLNDFFPDLQRFVVEAQYAREQWAMDTVLSPGLFPVKKGQQIAWSGNTGGSTGPHLHFELRDTETGHVLNPALFGFPLQDGLPPVPKMLAVYGPQSIYAQKPILVPLQKKGAVYGPASETIIVPYAKARVALKADDYMEGSTNTLGVYAMRLSMDDRLEASWKIAEIDFAQNRYVNAFADYRLKEQQKGWYQTLFRLPGNLLDVYDSLNKDNGLLDLSDAAPHQLRIELYDANGNRSGVSFRMQGQGGEGEQEKDCENLWRPLQQNTIKTATLDLSSGRYSVYDDVCLHYTEAPSAKHYSNIVQLLDDSYPLQDYVSLGLKLNKLVPFDQRTKLVFMHQVKAASLPGNHPQTGMAARFDKGWAYADVRTFGSFYVDVDTLGPKIVPLQKSGPLASAASIGFSVTDAMTSVKGFRAELDGKWLRFVRRGNAYTYKFDEHCGKGKHRLVITASDENDNLTTYTFDFTR